MTDPLCDCVVCETPIHDATEAVIYRERRDGASVTYRHADCDPATITPSQSTVVEM